MTRWTIGSTIAIAAVVTVAAGCGADDGGGSASPSNDAGLVDGPSAESGDSATGDVGTSDTGANDSAPSDSGHDASTEDVVCPPSCDDGNPCNGVESCNPSTGLCESSDPIVCDDGDPCNGLETCDPATGTCVDESFPGCPSAPPECGQTGGTGGPTVGQITAADPGGLRLYDEDQWASSAALVDGIALHPSVTPVTLTDVLANLNRTAQKVSSLAGTECFHTGFVWNSGDNGVTYWYPQGITGSGDASDDGAYQNRKVGMVSWYHKPENDSSTSANKGVRLSVYDVTDMNNIGYRLVLLVVPVDNGGVADFEAVPIHAGGIVWYKDYLYVADTSQGLRVFDLTRMLEVQTGNNTWIGKVSEADGYHAYGYRYVIPQVNRYRLCSSSCCARFSFVALDRSTSPHSLVAGEYSADSAAGRIHRWPLDEATGRMQSTGGRVQATEAVYPGVENMQGGLSWNGQYFMSCSGDFLGLHTGKVGQSVAKRGFPYGPEDLHYAPASDNLWSLTEHPGSRAVFSVKLSEIQAGCN